MYQIAVWAVLGLIKQVIRLAIAVEISRTYQAPASRQVGP